MTVNVNKVETYDLIGLTRKEVELVIALARTPLWIAGAGADLHALYSTICCAVGFTHEGSEAGYKVYSKDAVTVYSKEHPRPDSEDGRELA